MLASLLRQEAAECLKVSEETDDPDVRIAMLATAVSLHQGAERLELLPKGGMAKQE